MFEFLTDKKQFIRERRKREALQARQASTELATSVAFVLLAEGGSIDDVTATEHSDLFAPWVSGIGYEVGALRRHDGLLYRCVQAHSSQDDWTPDVSGSLWVKVGDPNEEYSAWAQPIGAHDAYKTGDKVSHDDRKWVSTVDGNVWTPGVYGWDEVV